MGRILEYINKKARLIMGLTKKATAYLKDMELIVPLVCATAGEVVVYLIILELNHLLEFPRYIRFPNPIEIMSLAVALPVAIFFGLVGSILFSRYRFNRKFGQNLEHLSKVNEVLSREDGTPNKYLPYKMIVSNIFLGSELSDKVTSLSHNRLSVSTGEFASILELFLDNLERNYTESVYIYSTCTLTQTRFMGDDLGTYRKKWEEFGAKFTSKRVCPRFVRLILPDLSPDTIDTARLTQYNNWVDLLNQEKTLSPDNVSAFITWNKENCFGLYQLKRPYPQNYYGIKFNPPPINDFMIIAEGSEDKPKGHVIIGGWRDNSKLNHFYIKYEKESARLKYYCEYFTYLKTNSKKINTLSDLC